jgi:uncharacterized protein
MALSSLPPRITSFLVKIASRCNLACDYCYIYEHADQSWRSQPPFMSDQTRRKLAERIGEYAKDEKLERLVVVFHGGEPLLAGADQIAETTHWIRTALPPSAKVDFSLQTNGTLLNEAAIECLAGAGISVSLSLDGPREANDLHRLDHAGESSFDKSLRALELLERYPETYAGLIAVIDPKTRPEELFSFFAPRLPPRLDFLLPDANYDRLPPGRLSNPDLYKNWLLQAFDLWFDVYPQLPVRMFDAVLSSIVGIPSDTDAFGFGDVTLLSIETDGSYHDLDVLKITAEGMSALGCGLESHSIAEAACAAQIAAHRKLLCKEGLADKCLACPEMEVCGGGSVPHRYSRNGFRNPTIYCEEMLALIGHARRRIDQTLHRERVSPHPVVTRQHSSIDLEAWERPENSEPLVRDLLENWALDVRPDFEQVLEYVAGNHEQLTSTVEYIRAAPAGIVNRLIVQPAVVLWTNVMSQKMRNVVVRSIDGEAIVPDPKYVLTLKSQLAKGLQQYPRIHEKDLWLRLPFGQRIAFENEEGAQEGAALTTQAFEIIEAWRPALANEIRLLDPDIQFIRDLDAHPDKAVSFSDNSTPGALYLCIRLGSGFIDPYLLADSIIHEHRHQKLYLLQRDVPLVEEDEPLVPSPWRDDLRPPSGLFHAVFVFMHLSEYWQHLTLRGATSGVRQRACGELLLIRERIEAALPTLRTTRLSKDGAALLDFLESVFRGGIHSAASGAN